MDSGWGVVDKHAVQLSIARLLEPYALLGIELAIAYGQGQDFAFALVRRWFP